MYYNQLLLNRLNQGVMFFLLLIASDAVFVIFHLVHKLTPFLPDSFFSLGRDWGYSELFQYVKIYWIVIMLGALWWRERAPVYLGWLLLFAYFLATDALLIHERGGAAIASHLGFRSVFGLRAVDYGELTVSGTVALVLLPLTFVLYLRSDRGAKNASQDLAILLGVLVFFGVFLDMVEILFIGGYVGGFIGMVEDGGEMIAVTLVCWYVFNLLEHRGNTSIPLWRLMKAALIFRGERPLQTG